MMNNDVQLGLTEASSSHRYWPCQPGLQQDALTVLVLDLTLPLTVQHGY